MPTICKQFRLGVFFDGTGNNKANDARHMADRKGQQHVAENEKDNDITYANDPSNISKLSDLYENGRTIEGDELKRMQVSATICEIRTKMIYIEGVGTISPTTKTKWVKGRQIGTQYAPGAHGTVPTYEWKQVEVKEEHNDYPTGLAMGVEGAKRINLAIDQVKIALKEHGPDNFNCIIDVFGFSRGAAMARDFINTFNKVNRKHIKNYKFGFIGIYDTVGSFGVPGNNIDYKPKDPSKHSERDTDALAFEWGISQKGSPSRNRFDENFEIYNFNLSARSAQKIYHITAADEYRINFPLTNIKGSGGFEVSCIGAHSDIGGGYAPTFKDRATFYPSEGRFFKDEGSWGLRHLVSSNRGVDNPVAKARAVATQKEQELEAGWKCKASSTSYKGITSAHVLCVQERTITNDLQNVSLQMMHTQAFLVGAPLKTLSPPSVPTDLQAYSRQANSGILAAAGYEPRKPILDKYAHRSSYDPKEKLHHRDVDGFVDRISNKMKYEDDKPLRDNYDNNAALAT